MTRKRAGTVAELRQALENLPGDTSVALVGCDCVGNWCGHFDNSLGSVWLMRDDNCEECEKDRRNSNADDV